MAQIQKDPSYVVNRSLDALGCGFALGSLADGTQISETARRSYGPMLRQLLRGSHWNFARKYAPLQLLGSATGQDWDGNTVPQFVEPAWQYAYAWPVDGVAARWLPWRIGTTSTPPQVTGIQAQAVMPYVRQTPARFLVSSSEEFPVVVGQQPWNQLPDLASTEGVGPIGRRVVLTNVADAYLVYTRLVLVIEEWDSQFEEAMVAFMAQRLALVAVKDRKEAIALRDTQIRIVKDQLSEARARNADDAGFPQTPDHVPDWIRARRFGGTSWGAEGLLGGPGVTYCGWESVSFSNGSVF